MPDETAQTDNPLVEALETNDSKPWIDLIDETERAFKFYNEKVDNIEKQYGNLKRLAEDSNERELQIFWANLEVLKPSLYARPPVPVVATRFKDYKETPRIAAKLIERSLITSYEVEDLHSTLILVRDDLAMGGRGVPWLRYAKDEKGERVAYDHIDRKDFLHEPARKWAEVGWVAKRAWMSRHAFKTRFPEADMDVVKFTKQGESDDDTAEQDDYKGEEKAPVWEVWSKTKNIVVWVTSGVERILDATPPFLTLDGFFPCPKPAYGTIQPRTLLPIPDYLFYMDQIEEINELTARISALAESLRVKGFYSGGDKDVSAAIETAMAQTDNNAILVPVSNFAAMGGASLKDSMIWLPVDMVASVIAQLVTLRRQLMDDIYQITGLSDIMRGDTNPNETLGAQRLKSQYGSKRIVQRQTELVRVSRDVTRIAAEIIAENFSPETVLQMSQVDDLPQQDQINRQIADLMSNVQRALKDPQVIALAEQNPQQAEQVKQRVERQIQELQNKATVEKVFELLRAQRTRPFVLEVETDSTIEPDEDADKERTTEYVTAVGSFIGAAGPMVQQEPSTAPFVAEMLKFIAGKFRVGREMESTIDEFADVLKQRASQPQQQGPSQEEKAKEALQAQQQKDATELKKYEIDKKYEYEDKKLAVEGRKADVQERQVELNEQIAESEHDLKVQGKELEERKFDEEREDTRNEVEYRETQRFRDEQETTKQMVVGALNLLAEALASPNLVLRDPETNAVLGSKRLMNGSADPESVDLNEALQNLTTALSQERRVVKDPETGRISGDEPVN